jgi:hypothetical protein
MLDRAGYCAVPGANRHLSKPENRALLKSQRTFVNQIVGSLSRIKAPAVPGGSNHYTEGYYDYAC